MNTARDNAPQAQANHGGRSAIRRGVLLGVLLLAARFPFLHHPVPVHPDEDAFVAGIGFPADYPVHPPGYPLWVGLGTLLTGIGLKPYAAYQTWSIVASVTAPLLFYVGLRWVVDDKPAWWLALGFGVNPLVWFQSTTALTYSTATAIGLLVVGFCHRSLTRSSRTAVLLAASSLAIGLTLRPDLLIYLGPLVAYTAWRQRKGAGAAAIIILVAGSLATYALVVHLYSRGDAASAAARFAHTRNVVLGTSVFELGLLDGLARNLIKIVANLAWDFGPAIILLPPAIWVFLRQWRNSKRISLLVIIWILPGGLFLLLMHVVQGYLMLLLPVGYLLIGLALQARCASKAATQIAAALAVLSACQFLFYPWSAESTGLKRLLDAKIAFQSAAGLRQIDRRKDIHRHGDFWPTRAHEADTTQDDAGS